MLKRVKKLYGHHNKKNKNDSRTNLWENGDINANYKQCYDDNYNIVNNTSVEKSSKFVGEVILTDNQPQTPLSTSTTKIITPTITATTSTTTATTSSTRTMDKAEPSTSSQTPNNNNNNIIQNTEKTKNATSLRKRLFKKSVMKNSHSSSKLRKDSLPELQRKKSLSKSMSDLFFDRRHSTPTGVSPTLASSDKQHQHQHDRHKENTNKTLSRPSIRSNVCSMDTLRENRRSVISKLDDYIVHLKKSLDEDSIANAPNRLCCAQLLRTVYLQREQQCHYASLLQHNKKDTKRHHSRAQTLKENNSDPDFLNYSLASRTRHDSRSLQDLNNTSFYSGSSSHAKVGFQHGTPFASEVSSMCINVNANYSTCDRFSTVTHLDRNGNQCDRGVCDRSYFSDDEGEDNIDSWNECYYLKSKVDHENNVCHDQNPKTLPQGVMTTNSRRKSMPIFPQALEIDIY